jgi:hypothetical protein
MTWVPNSPSQNHINDIKKIEIKEVETIRKLEVLWYLSGWQAYLTLKICKVQSSN